MLMTQTKLWITFAYGITSCRLCKSGRLIFFLVVLVINFRKVYVRLKQPLVWERMKYKSIEVKIQPFCLVAFKNNADFPLCRRTIVVLPLYHPTDLSPIAKQSLWGRLSRYRERWHASGVTKESGDRRRGDGGWGDNKQILTIKKWIFSSIFLIFIPFFCYLLVLGLQALPWNIFYTHIFIFEFPFLGKILDFRVFLPVLAAKTARFFAFCCFF